MHEFLGFWAPLLAVGAMAGFINTLAGNGSSLVLAFLSMFGIDPLVANASNRVGVLSQTLVGSVEFYRQGQLQPKQLKKELALCLAGAIPGMILAASIEAKVFKPIIGALMLALFLVLLTKADKKLLKKLKDKPYKKYIQAIALTITGFYGGFLQAGVGIFLTFALAFGLESGLVKANAVKSMVVLCFTIPSLAYFSYKGLVLWDIGLAMASTQALGAFVAARFASKSPQAETWVKSLLYLVLLLSALHFFGIF